MITCLSPRYVTSAIAFVFILILQGLSLFGLLYIRRINRTAALVALITATILVRAWSHATSCNHTELYYLPQNIIPIYHFVAMHNWTTSLTSTVSGSQNTAGEKAAFYIFQTVPELVTGGILLVCDVKTLFVTGVWGDSSREKSVQDESKV